MPKKQITIEAVNDRLKSGNVGLTLEARNKRLVLRGTFPPKPGSKKTKPHQQRLSLGVYNNPAGLQYAEAKAREYSAQIALKQFSWVAIDAEAGNEADSCERWVEAFKNYAYKNIIKGTEPEKEIKWRENFWYPAFSRLKPKKGLCEEEIIKAIETVTPDNPDSRARQLCCQKMGKLAKFAGIQMDLEPYKGNYLLSEVIRTIPSDEEIVKAIDEFTGDRSWQIVLARIATFGLRPHEVWYSKVSQVQHGIKTVWMCEVTDGKTGERKSIPPLHPDWVERWQLYEDNLPTANVLINKQYSGRTSIALRRCNHPHQPYSYRHAFAIRASLHYGFPTAVVSKWLGHTPTVFLNIYQKHITEAQATEAFFEKV